MRGESTRRRRARAVRKPDCCSAFPRAAPCGRQLAGSGATLRTRAGGDAMRWQGEEGSSNVEDRRGEGAPMGMPVGGMRFPGGGGGLGIAGVLVLLVIGWLTGINPLDLVNGGSSGNGGSTAPAPARSSGDEEQLKQFVSVVL